MFRTASVSAVTSSIGILEGLRECAHLAATRSIADHSPCDIIDKRPDLIGLQYESYLSRLIKGTLTSYVSSSGDGTTRNEGFTGIIIQGSSGSGKTALARRLAYECRRHFKLISVPCSELVHKVVGDSEKRIRELFAEARKAAPVLILLENIETLLGQYSPARREGAQGVRYARTNDHALDRILSSFLVEIDGFTDENVDGGGGRFFSSPGCFGKGSSGSKPAKSLCISRPVVVIATTRDIGCIDPALLRPGRLEEHVYLGLPTTQDRKSLIEFYLSDMEIAGMSKSSEEFVSMVEKITSCMEGR